MPLMENGSGGGELSRAEEKRLAWENTALRWGKVAMLQLGGW